MIGFMLIGAVIYALIGVVVALMLLLLWRGSFDSAAEKGSWGFRVSIFPGLVALWPVIAAKRIGLVNLGLADSPLTAEKLRKLHGLAVLILAVTVPPLFYFALAGRVEEVVSTVEIPAGVK